MHFEDSRTRLGFWSSFVALLAASAYSLAQIGSPPLIPLFAFPWSDVLILVPSLVLPLALIVAFACIHAVAARQRSIWSLAGLGFAVAYASMVGMVYIVQLAVVIPAKARGRFADVAAMSLSAPWVQAIDAFGYALMSLAFLFTAAAFTREGLSGLVRRWFVAHGLLAPIILLPLWFPPILAVGTLWFVTAPVALLCLARWFRHVGKTRSADSAHPGIVFEPGRRTR